MPLVIGCSAPFCHFPIERVTLPGFPKPPRAGSLVGGDDVDGAVGVGLVDTLASAAAGAAAFGPRPPRPPPLKLLTCSRSRSASHQTSSLVDGTGPGIGSPLAE